MAKKNQTQRVIEGVYSVRTENPDGTVASFVIDDDKLIAHVKAALADYNSEKPAKESTVKTKPLKKPQAKPAKKKLKLEDLQTMSKTDLEQLGREMGAEIDRRKRKDQLVQELLALSAK